MWVRTPMYDRLIELGKHAVARGAYDLANEMLILSRFAVEWVAR